MVEFIIVTIIGLTCFGLGLKYLTYKCDVENEIDVITVDNDILIEDEVPPKYEDI